MADLPYASVKTVEVFKYLDGTEGRFDETVSSDGVPRKYVQEVMMIQTALGVKPDGQIGPEMRKACVDIATANASAKVEALAAAKADAALKVEP